MDFVSDTLYGGRTFRVFNMIDDCSRESIVQHVDFSITGVRLTRIFDDLKKNQITAEASICDNGTELHQRHSGNGQKKIMLIFIISIKGSRHRMHLLKALMESSEMNVLMKNGSQVFHMQGR